MARRVAKHILQGKVNAVWQHARRSQREVKKAVLQEVEENSKKRLHRLQSQEKLKELNEKKRFLVFLGQRFGCWNSLNIS